MNKINIKLSFLIFSLALRGCTNMMHISEYRVSQQVGIPVYCVYTAKCVYQYMASELIFCQIVKKQSFGWPGGHKPKQHSDMKVSVNKVIQPTENNQKNFTDYSGLWHLGQVFGRVGWGMKVMPFWGKMAQFNQKWHILHFLVHNPKHLTPVSCTVGVGEVFLVA